MCEQGNTIMSALLSSSLFIPLLFLLLPSYSSSAAPFPVHSYKQDTTTTSYSRHHSRRPAPSVRGGRGEEEEELYSSAPSLPHLYSAAPTAAAAASGPPLLAAGEVVYGPWLSGGRGGGAVTNRLNMVVLPARRVCEKGWMDSDLKACVYYDKNDKRTPVFTCPEGSRLEGDYCHGRIISDFEISCPKKFAANTAGLCVRAIVYSPSRIVCPEGFEIRSFTSARLKQCVKVMYAKPRHVPVENLLPPLPPPTASKLARHNRAATEQNATTTASSLVSLEDPAGGGRCVGGVKEKFCPLPPGTYTADKQFLLECAEGRLVKMHNTKEAVCRVRMVVPADTRDTCKKGYSWTTVEGAGAACMRLSAFESLKVCPQPTPKLGPGLGDWDTPDYHYHPVDRCVAYRAKASGGSCPTGYVLEKQVCVRKLVLPYYYDCNNLEGFGFRWNVEEQLGECVFEFDSFKWSAGVPHITKRDEFDNARIQLFSNPYEVKVAYQASIAAQTLRGE
eukprot:GHVS01065084.1.p1 GENE.GHVS01065084.1~~GHVS01065084.1.p1  ORF type:complete len:504 (+),score=121.60 GHVS01065084.1:155-1666(+)